MDGQGFELKIKNNQGTYTVLYPKTIKKQILGWNVGEVYGPIVVDLKVNGWIEGEQKINYTGISSMDILYGVPTLSGDKIQMQSQIQAYNLLSSFNGIESLNNSILFRCSDKKNTPKTDIQIQVWWTK